MASSKFTIDLSALSKDQLKSKLGSIEESFLKELGEEITNADAISGGGPVSPTNPTEGEFGQAHISGGWLKN
ncbi:hypothetical protein [Chitinophaga flava]|uniref:Uncharacterized protein n=1 Tax=Chitinophaga flava TaxID=2259036 RepID=A0A365XTF9_9BACT|nr:hypothetical protein [Chitinophaga flava]RBL89639.1 hypothetical protein DF182_24370 [Chitinophaga flava]